VSEASKQVSAVDEPSKSSRTILIAIAVALAIWGTYLAIGTFVYGRRPIGALIVLACTAVFLGVWGLALWSRERSRRD